MDDEMEKKNSAVVAGRHCSYSGVHVETVSVYQIPAHVSVVLSHLVMVEVHTGLWGFTKANIPSSTRLSFVRASYAFSVSTGLEIRQRFSELAIDAALYPA